MVDELEEIGQRVATARNDTGLTQAQLAQHVGLERSSLAKIETGSRRVSALELARIAEALGQRIEWFISAPPPAVVSRRQAQPSGEAASTFDRTLERLAREVEFVLEAAGADLSVEQPLDFPAGAEEAEQAAAAARVRLGLESESPTGNLSRRAAELGLYVFSLALGDQTPDGGCVLLDRGGVALINGDRHVGRRRLTAAHELGHYLFADAYSVDWRVAVESNESREARIDRFARALLLPRAALAADWRRLLDTEGLRVAAVRVASTYQVDMSTLARRLQDLDLVDRDTAGRVRAVRTTRADIVDHDLLVPVDHTPPELPRQYEEAVLALYRQETLSAPRALELLLDTFEEADLPELPALPHQAIWKFIS